MLQVQEVTKKFRRVTALKGISLDIDKGVYGLLGPNGAGKTTLMRCIVRLYEVSSGDILLDGKSIKKDDRLLSGIGYLPQKFGLFKELKVYDMMEYLATLKKIPKAKQKEAIEKCVELVNLTDRLYDKVGHLSGGMVRRLGIAQAILGDPPVVIVDEPTAGLDPEERMRFKNLIAKIKKDKTIIISTHIVEDVESTCDHIIIMDQGNIVVSGTSEEILNLAKGKVYQVFKEDEATLPEDSFTEKITEQGSMTILRVLSDTPPKGGTELEPSVEDGYLYAIRVG